MTANTETEGELEVAETGGATGGTTEGVATEGTTAGGVGCVAEDLDAEEVDEAGGVGVLVVAGTTGKAATTLFCPGVTICPVAVGKAPV